MRMDAGPLLSVAERYDALRRDTTGVRWAAASMIGGSTGMLSTLVVDAWLAAVAGLVIGLGALRRDRRHGCLPELAHRSGPVPVRRVRPEPPTQRGWTVFPSPPATCSPAPVAFTSPNTSWTRSPFPITRSAVLLRSRCEVACHTARRLTGELSTRAERVSVHTVVIMNAPTDDPYLHPAGNTAPVDLLPAWVGHEVAVRYRRSGVRDERQGRLCDKHPWAKWHSRRGNYPGGTGYGGHRPASTDYRPSRPVDSHRLRNLKGHCGGAQPLGGGP